MAAPFTDFVMPGPVQSAALLIGAGTVFVLLYALRPPVTQRTVLALIPWMISGGILHVFWQLGQTVQDQLYPPVIADLFAAPAVYLTTFMLVGAIWIVSSIIVPSYDRSDRIATYLATTGVGVLIPLVGLLLWQGLGEEIAPMKPVWPVLGLIISLVLTFVLYMAIGAWRTYVIAEARYVGAFVLFAHVFDGVTTAIGVEQLGASERSALPRAIMEFAAGLPTADLLGEAWLFVVVKLVLATTLVAVFHDYVAEEPAEGTLFLTGIAAIGLGPGAHNFFLFLFGV